MSRPGESGVPEVRPHVYHPYETADPTSYEEYRDPAAAHGWENAYDETTELPRLASATAEPGGRADRRRAARRAGAWRERRVLAAAGAIGAVALAAVVAGFSLSGDPAGDRQDTQGGTRSASDDTASPSDEASAGGSAGSAGSATSTGSTASGGSARAASSASSASSTGAPASGATVSKAPSAGSPAGAVTGSTASSAPSAATSAPGKGNPGKGRGPGKGGR